MALRQIIKDGDETLRKKSREITEVTPRIQELIDDMIETMYANNGVGLAAPQVGVLRRLFVADVKDGSEPLVAINPRIISADGIQCDVEGCLSVPGKWGEVRRPQTITLAALDRQGKPYTMEAEGRLAVCICHETDHLDGVLFVDKVEGELFSE
ncbi:MAG: peptide deformylase [Saccharofermentanales bacterium]|jgi:peptide deformylase|nr:peptide deformylase [Clostridiaceae bacterium]